MTSVDHRAAWTYGTMLFVGVLGGLVELITDADKTSTSAGVAAANWAHILLAIALLVATTVVFRLSPSGLAAFARRPWTPAGWSAL